MKRLFVGVVEWLDAALYERASYLEQCRLVEQVSIGQIYENAENKTYIIVSTAQKDGNCFDAIVVPKCWVTKIMRLKEVNRGKSRAKKMG